MSDRPSVTQILGALGFSKYFGSHEYAMALGRAVHRAIHLAERGTLDWATVHADLEGPLKAYRALKEWTGIEITETEIELVHPTWGYVGHPDALTDKGMLIDWKVSESPDLKTATLQLAAYKMLVEGARPGTTVSGCYVGRLGKDGSYSLHDVTSPESEQTWQACVLVYRALEERGRV